MCDVNNEEIKRILLNKKNNKIENYKRNQYKINNKSERLKKFKIYAINLGDKI